MGYQTMDSEICPTFKKKETQFGTPEIKGNLHLDEKYINVKGKYCYDLNVIDRKTKFVLSELFVRQRTINKCKTLLNKIKMWCYQQIMLLYRQGLTVIKFVADNFSNYHTAWKRTLARITTMDAGVPITCKKYGLHHNNNCIERYNREITRRMDAIDVFQTFDGAKDFFALRTIVYNYVNPHNSLKGKTPAEAAGIILDLGQNKLLSLITHARKIEMTLK